MVVAYSWLLAPLSGVAVLILVQDTEQFGVWINNVIRIFYDDSPSVLPIFGMLVIVDIEGVCGTCRGCM